MFVRLHIEIDFLTISMYGMLIDQLVSVSGNKVCVCYHLRIRHTTEHVFVMHIISETTRCYFHIKEKYFTHILSYAAYYNH